MVFNTTAFILFLIVVFILYHSIFSKSTVKQNSLLLFSAYFFYSWWSLKFLFLFIATSLIDYTVARLIETETRKKKWLLVFSIGINLLVLGFFKYYNFFVNEFCELFDIDSQNAGINIVLPLGISFYTFQGIAYVIDVYRKTTKAEKNILTYLCFISFFPQLVAGPIERANTFLVQFKQQRVFDYLQSVKGLELLLLGYVKKTVLADNLAVIVNRGFENPEVYSGFSLITAVICFTLQIYFDFSGYTDIARGCARLFGFELSRNFNNPFFSESINRFWKRWHISLTSWFKDYLYIPLGGNKKGEIKTGLNIVLVFLLSGLWHGANITFLFWGLYHGMLSLSERVIKLKIKLPKVLAIIFTFFLIAFGFLFFRASDMNRAFDIITNIIKQTGVNTIFYGFTAFKIIGILICIAGVLYIERLNEVKPELIQNVFAKKYIKYSFYYAAILSLFAFAVYNNEPDFIYFRF